VTARLESWRMPERRAIVLRYHFGKTEGSAPAVELLLRARLGSRCFSSRQLSIKMRFESQATTGTAIMTRYLSV
jgi:hypothetical protein